MSTPRNPRARKRDSRAMSTRRLVAQRKKAARRQARQARSAA